MCWRIGRYQIYPRLRTKDLKKMSGSPKTNKLSKKRLWPKMIRDVVNFQNWFFFYRMKKMAPTGQNVPRQQNFPIKKIKEIILQFSLFFKFWQLLTFQMAILIKKRTVRKIWIFAKNVVIYIIWKINEWSVRFLWMSENRPNGAHGLKWRFISNF